MNQLRSKYRKLSKTCITELIFKVRKILFFKDVIEQNDSIGSKLTILSQFTQQLIIEYPNQIEGIIDIYYRVNNYKNG